MQHTDEAPLLTRREAAARLGISVDSLDRLVEKAEIPTLRFGRSVRIQQKDLVALIERRSGTRRRTRPTCSRCKRRIAGARIVVNGQWMCATCLYELECGASRAAAPPPAE